jgi:hypothetical protein
VKRSLFAPLAALLLLAASAVAQTPPTVLDYDSASPRRVTVIFEGDTRAYLVTATPVLRPVDPTPGPGPTPGPTPPPAPTPVVEGPLWVSYVVDAQDVTVEQSAIRSDPTLRAELRKLDATFRTYQNDEAEVANLRLPKYFAGKLPALIVQDQKGMVVSAERVGGAAEILTKVKAYRGQK